MHLAHSALLWSEWSHVTQLLSRIGEHLTWPWIARCLRRPYTCVRSRRQKVGWRHDTGLPTNNIHNRKASVSFYCRKALIINGGSEPSLVYIINPATHPVHCYNMAPLDRKSVLMTLYIQYVHRTLHILLNQYVGNLWHYKNRIATVWLSIHFCLSIYA